MKRTLHILSIIIFIGVSTSLYGMKRKNSTTLTIRNPNYIRHQAQEVLVQGQEGLVLPPEIIARIAGFCWSKEKNLLMRLCKDFCVCLKDRQLILRANLRTVGFTDKVEALIEYAREGDLNMTKFLLKNGVKANCYNILGIKPFHDAHNDVMPLLIEYGANENEPKPELYPLHEAAYKGDKEMVEMLLALKADPNRALAIGATPLIIASQKGRTEIVKILLTADGIEVNKALHDITPLYIASQKGYTKIVKLLLKVAGIEVNKAFYDITPLYIASQNGHTEIVKLLLKVAGIEVNKAGRNGWRPLSIASYYGNTEIVKLLLDHKANIHAVVTVDSPKALIKAGDTALDIARKKGHVHVVELLEAKLRCEVIEKRL